MPPSLPSSFTETVSQASIEAPDEDAPLLAFFSTSGAALAIQENAFTQKELVGHMILEMRSMDPMVARAARVQYLAYVEKLLTLKGRIGKASAERKTTTPNGNTTREVVEVTRILPPASRPNPAFRSQGEIIPASLGGSSPAGPSSPAEAPE